MIVPILRTQTEILSQLESLTFDTSNERWTEARFYEAVNMALMDWEGRVRIPYLYSLSSGWVDGTYEYTLPAYIDAGTIQPQGRSMRYSLLLTDLDGGTWTDIQGFDVDPNSSGGQTLRLHYLTNSQARVLWWGSNGAVPTTAAVLQVSLSASTSHLTLTTKPTVGQSGYIKINGEWMQYSGTVEGPTTLTLLNLVRGMAGSTATSHATASTVAWGIAFDRGGLWGQLLDQTRAHLMEFWLSNPASREVGQYEKQMVFFQQRADAFWRKYTSARAPRIRLSRMGMGVRGHTEVLRYITTTTTATDTLVLCDGDSLTFGTGATDSYPTQLQDILGDDYDVNNQGVGGQTLTQMEADGAADLDPRVVSSRTCILCAWGGTNDIFLGDSAAVAYADYVTYCTNRRAAGWTVIAFTITPRSDAGVPGTFEASRQTFNTNVRSHWHEYADVVVDLAGHTTIGDSGDEANATYYSTDLVHMTDAGYTIVANLVANAIRILEAL
jgi:lysophospholipase L1-like esterase